MWHKSSAVPDNGTASVTANIWQGNCLSPDHVTNPMSTAPTQVLKSVYHRTPKVSAENCWQGVDKWGFRGPGWSSPSFSDSHLLLYSVILFYVKNPNICIQLSLHDTNGFLHYVCMCIFNTFNGYVIIYCKNKMCTIYFTLHAWHQSQPPTLLHLVYTIDW